MASNTEMQSDLNNANVESQLDTTEIRSRVSSRLKKYDQLNSLEQFAMFMGMAQLLEIRLKQLHSERSSIDIEKLEGWTMGRTIRTLAETGLRPDLIELLESVRDYRNYIAHEYLANVALLQDLIGANIGRLEAKHFEKGIYQLEQVVVLFDWCEDNDAW